MKKTPNAGKQMRRESSGAPKKKLRINFILPPGNLSGGPLAIMEYASRLLEKGHDVSITTYPTMAWPPKWKKTERPFPWFPFKGKYYYYKSSGLDKKFHSLMARYFLGLGGNEAVKQHMGLAEIQWECSMVSYLIGAMPECDINIATLWSTAYAAFLSKKGKPVYFMQHYEEVFYPIEDQLVLHRLGARMSYQLPIYKIANSSWLQNLIMEKCGQMIPFSNNAIDLNDFHPGPKRSEKDQVIRVLTFSRPEAWKGFADVAAAMAKIHFEYGDRVEWHVFGQEHMFIKPMNVDTPYILHTGLPFKELAALYAECDLVVCGSWYESFPLPPLEAMASGTAVVTTLNGMEDYCVDRENCLVVKTRDVDCFVSAIQELIENAELRKRLEKAGLQTAARYDWGMAVERREKMLYDIFEGRVRYNPAQTMQIGLADDAGTPFEKMPDDLRKKFADKSKISFSGMIFQIDKGCRRHIITSEVLASLSMPGEEIKEVDALTFSRIPQGLPIWSLNDV